MNIEDKRKEITMLIENIKEHSDRLTGTRKLQLLELSAIISKSNKLHEDLLFLKFMLEQKGEAIEDEITENREEGELEETIEMKEETGVLEAPEEEIDIQSPILESEKSPTATEDDGEEEGFIFQLQSTETGEEQADTEEEPTTEEDEIEQAFIDKELSLSDLEESEDLSSKPDLNEAFSEKEDSSLSEQLKKQPIGDLLSAIALNERYVYANELFDGDIEDFRRVMAILNEFETREEASQFFNRELRQNYGWEEDNEMADALFQLVERRFQS